MPEKISAYRSTDGMVFDTFKEAQAHDNNLLRSKSVATFIDSIGASGASVTLDAGSAGQPLEHFLLTNHEALVAALSVKPKTWSRKKKQEPSA